jgi:hypothetical protein
MQVEDVEAPADGVYREDKPFNGSDGIDTIQHWSSIAFISKLPCA